MPGESIRENKVPATVAAEGNYDEVVYCTTCHAELSCSHKTQSKLLFIISITANTTAAKTGEAITWTAAASGGSGTLQYYFILY